MTINRILDRLDEIEKSVNVVQQSVDNVQKTVEEQNTQAATSGGISGALVSTLTSILVFNIKHGV